MHSVMDPPEKVRTTMPLDRENQESTEREDRETQTAVRELLAILPADVLGDIRSGDIDAHDPAFLNGLMDHASRLSLADPRNGRRILGKIIRLRKLINRNLRESDPAMALSATVVSDGKRVGRNALCPCGSGHKYKQCCMRKA
jgi:hypothetical protein